MDSLLVLMFDVICIALLIAVVLHPLRALHALVDVVAAINVFAWF